MTANRAIEEPATELDRINDGIREKDKQAAWYIGQYVQSFDRTRGLAVKASKTLLKSGLTFVTEEEAARLLKVPVSAVQEWISSHQMRALLIQGEPVVPFDSVVRAVPLSVYKPPPSSGPGPPGSGDGTRIPRKARRAVARYQKELARGEERWEDANETVQQVGRRLYTVKQAAKLLGVAASAMEEWIEHDLIRTVPIKGQVRVLSDDVLDACNVAIQARLIALEEDGKRQGRRR